MYDIITVGSNTIDTFVLTDKKYFKSRTYTYPVGSKILIRDLHFSIGGGGTNTAVCFSRLGLKTAYLGVIGSDANGRIVLDYLKKENIATVLVQKDNIKTGFSVILDAKGEDRTILTFKGSNNDLIYEKIPKSRLRAKWFYFSAMVGKSFESIKKLSMYASKKGIKVAFNPSSYLAKKGKRYLSKILSNTSLLVLNREEAALITGTSKINNSLLMLNKMGPDYVVITDGKKGAYALFEGNKYYVKPHNFKVKETTGAGDAFASSFLAGLILKNDVKFALSLAQTNAESVITHYGAKEKLLTLKEAKKQMKRYPVDIVQIAIKKRC